MARWTVTFDGVLHVGRPLSGEAVRRFYDALATAPDGEHDAIVFALFRKVFPLSWRRVWWWDTARRLLRSPARNAVLAEWLAVPAPAVEPIREPDEWDRLEQAQRVADEPNGARITLDTACRLTEVLMGPGWYFNPERWPTWDGYAPYEAVWETWYTMQRARAWERLNLVRAIGITKAGERAQALYDSDVREALGG